MKEWLSSNPVDGEDMLRHDKWLCMMWPRLTLLRELLSERGAIWITLDDNEVHRARMVLDELFGEENFVGCFVWRKVDSPNDNKVALTPDHEFVLSYAKDKSTAEAHFRHYLHRASWMHTGSGRVRAALPRSTTQEERQEQLAHRQAHDVFQDRWARWRRSIQFMTTDRMRAGRLGRRPCKPTSTRAPWSGSSAANRVA
jgi:hypothetical protein